MLKPESFRDYYELPQDLWSKFDSSAFAKFMMNWFGDTRALSRKEVNLDFIDELTPEEREAAKSLLRRNLPLQYAHIIEGIVLLDDKESIPDLCSLLQHTADLSRQLVIGGALWQLSQDSVFPALLEEMKTSQNGALKQVHFHQIAWLRDERALNLYFDLLNDRDDHVRFLALRQLNELEYGKRFLTPPRLLPHQTEHYKAHEYDSDLRAAMLNNLRCGRTTRSGAWIPI